MDTTTADGLTVTYDEENGVFHLEWDENEHPEYNFLGDLTEDEFSQMLMDQLKKLHHAQETTNSESSEV